MARACAESSLDDLYGLLVADLEDIALPALTVPQGAVDQAAGAGHTTVNSEEGIVERSFFESCFLRMFLCYYERLLYVLYVVLIPGLLMLPYVHNDTYAYASCHVYAQL